MKINNTNLNNKTSFTGIYNSKIIKKGLEFAANNGSLFAAGTSLVLSTAARPAAILLTPKTDKENKRYACAKSIASSAVGYLLMLGASLPVANAIKNIDKNPYKYLKQSTIQTLKQNKKILTHSKQYKFVTQLFKLGVGFVIAVPKSILTCALIPPIMYSLFGKKTKEKSENKSKQVSFKGSYQKNIEKLSKGIGKIIDTNFMKKISNKFHNTNFEQHIISLTDILLTGTFIKQTKNSKKIEESRKRALMYNAGIATGLSITGGYTINSLLKNPTNKFIKKFAEINKKDPKLDKYIEGIKVAKPVLILGGIYYLVIPFISTFVSDKLDNQKNCSK